jgi:hypothetical protein
MVRDKPLKVKNNFDVAYTEYASWVITRPRVENVEIS